MERLRGRVRISRFKRRESARSGFAADEIQMVTDADVLAGRITVTAEEIDQSPPDRRPIGGEGERSGEPRYTGIQFVIAQVSAPITTVTYVTATGGITPVILNSQDVEGRSPLTLPWMQVAGSNSAITITANPAIAAGQERQVLALECVGSTLTINSSAGVQLLAGRTLKMTSGSVSVFYYNTSNNAWQETNRTP